MASAKAEIKKMEQMKMKTTKTKTTKTKTTKANGERKSSYNPFKVKGNTVIGLSLVLLWLSTKGNCANCGNHFSGYKDWTCEHLIPQSEFIANGIRIDNSLGNITLACKGCNSARGNKSEFAFYGVKKLNAIRKNCQKALAMKATKGIKKDAEIVEIAKAFATESRQFAKDFFGKESFTYRQIWGN